MKNDCVSLHYKDYLSLGITASGTWECVALNASGYVRLFTSKEGARLDRYVLD